MSVLLALGVIVALTIVAAVAVYYMAIKSPILALMVQSNGSLGVVVNATANPSTFVGKRLYLKSQAIGNIYTSVCNVAPYTGSTSGVAGTVVLSTPVQTYLGVLPAGSLYPYSLPVDPKDLAILTSMW
jgi:hypothetical protein